MCKECGNPTENKVFCSVDCKSAWQSKQKPVDREWLYQKYVVEGVSSNRIAKMVNRDPKRVWEWLKNYGIETRPRGHNYELIPQFSFWKYGTDSPFLGRKHTDESKKKMSDSSKGESPWLRGPVHHLYGVKGPDNPFWKGGTTPERQELYASTEWKKATRKIWKRDDGTCKKCKCRKDDDRAIQFDIHHIYSFSDYPDKRCEIDNLVLLCRPCHLWVHSSSNVNKDFLGVENA